MNKPEFGAETRSERRRLARRDGQTVPPAAPKESLPPVAGLSVAEKAGLAALWLALFLAPVIGGYPSGVVYTADTSLNALRLLILLAGGVLLFAAPAKHSVGMGRTAAIALWVAFGLTLLSLLVHSQFFRSDALLFAMLPATLDWLCFGVVFTLTMRYANEAWARTGTIVALLLGAGWAALTAVDAYIGPFSRLASDSNYLVAFVAWFIRIGDVVMGAPAARAQGSFFSPNFLAGFIGLILPIAVAFFLTAQSKRGAWGAGMVAGLSVAALFATGSRAGAALAFGGLAVAFGLYLFARRGAGMPWRQAAIIVAVFVVLAVAFRGPLTRRVEGGGQDHSGAFRSWTWRGTQAMAQANPLLGTGPGTFPYAYPRYAQVARTDLAHSSYLQVAAEQGFPALLAVGLALIGVFGAAGRNLRAVQNDHRAALPLCALTGGLLASVLHNAFDTEWALLGNALPFWAIAGLAAGIGALPTVAAVKPLPANEPAPARLEIGRPLLGLFIVAGCVVGFLLLRESQYRSDVLAQMRGTAIPIIKLDIWPPDPTLFYNAGKLEDAARIEPSGKRFYQLARFYVAKNQLPQAVDALKKSLEAEPTSLQTWRKMAEIQEKAGDHAGALLAWRELVKRQEGPVGQYRAIPELPETHAAFAYVALARDAIAQTQNAEAQTLYEKAATIIDEYSKTPSNYQEMELANAEMSGVNIAARRQELTDLYAKIIAEWSALSPDKSVALQTRRDETLKRIADFLQPRALNAPLPGNVAP